MVVRFFCINYKVVRLVILYLTVAGLIIKIGIVQTYGRTDPNYRKASLLEMLSFQN